MGGNFHGGSLSPSSPNSHESLFPPPPFFPSPDFILIHAHAANDSYLRAEIIVYISFRKDAEQRKRVCLYSRSGTGTIDQEVGVLKLDFSGKRFNFH